MILQGTVQSDKSDLSFVHIFRVLLAISQNAEESKFHHGFM
jgi:hypothetical protein